MEFGFCSCGNVFKMCTANGEGPHEVVHKAREEEEVNAAHKDEEKTNESSLVSPRETIEKSSETKTYQVGSISPSDMLKVIDDSTKAFQHASAGSIGCLGLTSLQNDEFSPKAMYCHGLNMTKASPEEEITELERRLQIQGVGFCARKGLKDPPNQDNIMIYCEPAEEPKDVFIIGSVFDGHGADGHDVSHYMVHLMMWILLKLRASKIHLTSEKCLKEVFELCQDSLILKFGELKKDIYYSGCTGSLIIKQGKEVTCAWVGDSRVIMSVPPAKPGLKYKISDVSFDHKPELTEEEERIVKHGGEVLKLEGDVPYRVFKKGSRSPGLAMSRAFGDLASQEVGVTFDPDIKIVRIEDGCFVSACTDGVWEFITSEQCGRVIQKTGQDNLSEASLKICKESRKRWLYNEQDVVDDITVLILWPSGGT